MPGYKEIQQQNLVVNNFTITETGFNLLFLNKYIEDFIDNDNPNLNQDEDNGKNNEVQQYFYDVIDVNNYIFTSVKIVLKFIFSLMVSICIFFDYFLFVFLFILSCGKCRKNFLIYNFFKMAYRKSLESKNEDIEKAYNFFLKNTRSIEVLRNEKVNKVYFFLQPFNEKILNVII